MARAMLPGGSLFLDGAGLGVFNLAFVGKMTSVRSFSMSFRAPK
jgi:hypothetical protein